jgi:hypothetical protein
MMIKLNCRDTLAGNSADLGDSRSTVPCHRVGRCLLDWT